MNQNRWQPFAAPGFRQQIRSAGALNRTHATPSESRARFLRARACIRTCVWVLNKREHVLTAVVGRRGFADVCLMKRVRARTRKVRGLQHVSVLVCTSEMMCIMCI